jgi:hypothetical protein
MDSSSSNRPRSASSFESNTHFNIESIRGDPDCRSFLNSILYVKPAFHKLLRTKSKVGFVRQSKRSAKGEASYVHSPTGSACGKSSRVSTKFDHPACLAIRYQSSIRTALHSDWHDFVSHEIVAVREIISHSAPSSGSSFFRWFASHLWSSSPFSFCSSGA